MRRGYFLGTRNEQTRNDVRCREAQETCIILKNYNKNRNTVLGITQTSRIGSIFAAIAHVVVGNGVASDSASGRGRTDGPGDRGNGTVLGRHGDQYVGGPSRSATTNGYLCAVGTRLSPPRQQLYESQQ